MAGEQRIIETMPKKKKTFPKNSFHIRDETKGSVNQKGKMWSANKIIIRHELCYISCYSYT